MTISVVITSHNYRSHGAQAAHSADDCLVYGAGISALREVKRDCWANVLRYNESIPFGAGVCVRIPGHHARRHTLTATTRTST